MRAFIFSLTLYFAGVFGAQPTICVKHIVSPGYPPVARLTRLQGTVIVDLRIGPDGRVLSASSTGNNEILCRASEDNIREWIFSPSVSRREPSAMRFTYDYKLAGDEEKYGSAPTILFDLPDRVEIVAHPLQPQT